MRYRDMFPLAMDYRIWIVHGVFVDPITDKWKGTWYELSAFGSHCIFCGFSYLFL
jgi:hypothetical protein